MIIDTAASAAAAEASTAASNSGPDEGRGGCRGHR